MLKFSPLEQKLVSLFMKQYKINKGSKNCPNDRVFHFAYNYINFNSNHMIKSVSERQNIIISHILFSDYYVIYLIYTTSISVKQPNIWTIL